MNNHGAYVYAVMVRESLLLRENVIKFGYTKKGLKNRMSQYPKGSVLVSSTACDPAVVQNVETEVLIAARERFKQRTDMGVEYFQGDVRNMIALLQEVAMKYVHLLVESIDLTVKLVEEKESVAPKVPKKAPVPDLHRLMADYIEENRETLHKAIVKSSEVFDKVKGWLDARCPNTLLTSKGLRKSLQAHVCMCSAHAKALGGGVSPLPKRRSYGDNVHVRRRWKARGLFIPSIVARGAK